LDGFDSILGGESPHNKRQLPVECHLDRTHIDPLNVFKSMSAAAIYFHNKFGVLHSLSLLLTLAAKLVSNQRFIPPTIWVTLTTVRDSPHSKQHASNRDVINP
jgi:hypothetical protein